MRKRAGWAAGLALVVVLSSCGGASDEDGPRSAGPPKKGTVILRDIAFKPDKVIVEAGDAVTWAFDDQGISHDVVADDGSFKSEVMDSGTFRHTFETRGTFPYKCSLHPTQMTGTVTVR